MLAGELYEAWDPDLVSRRARARDLAARYNATRQLDVLAVVAVERRIDPDLLAAAAEQVA